MRIYAKVGKINKITIPVSYYKMLNIKPGKYLEIEIIACYTKEQAQKRLLK